MANSEFGDIVEAYMKKLRSYDRIYNLRHATKNFGGILPVNKQDPDAFTPKTNELGEIAP